MALVKFKADVSPYCKGDTVNLADDELVAVDSAVERRGLKDAYEVVEETVEEAVSATPETEAPTVKKKGGKK